MKQKKIFLVGPPFCGHLHPLLGIGRRLSAVADVTVVSTPTGVQSARASGLRGREILATDEKSVWAISDPGRDVKNNPLLLYRQLSTNVSLLAGLKTELDALYLAEKPDLVIADFTVPVAGISATQQGIPWWTTLPSPCVFETADGPPAYFGAQTPARTWSRKVLHAGMRAATRLFKRLMFLLFRREFLRIGFTSVYRDDGTEAVYSPQHVFGLGIPEIEFPRSYPPQFHFIGPVLHTPNVEKTPPTFVSDGRPHVLITFGTHLHHVKADLAAVFRGIAARNSGIIFHFSHGKASSDTALLEGNFHVYSFVSYASHLPRYDLVVHHAGTGVLQHCLSHGKPAVVYPLDFDQFDYAARLVAVGLALWAKSVDELESAILRTLQDRAMQERCLAMKDVYGRYNAEEFVFRLVREMD